MRMHWGVLILNKTMITIKNLTKHILGEPLFERVSFTIHKGDKVGLIGPNGSGKSTLIKILLGEIEADGGSVDIKQERIGYLSQGLPFQPGDTILSFLAERDYADQQKMLSQVGLGGIVHDTPVSELSGGQKTRLALARLLLAHPTSLLLDEPTNHLDAAGVEWLEDFLKNFKGSVLLVSHDRRLLDSVVGSVLEIDPVNQTFLRYQGGYTDYMQQKNVTVARQQDAYERQQREKRRMELWLALKRQEAHIHADPAKGKMIRAMERRLQREVYDNEIVRPESQKKIRVVELQGQVPNSKFVLRVSGVNKAFGVRSVLWDINFEQRGKERILLAGENGSGKTTLLKIITGELLPDKGEVFIGAQVRMGYFAQQQESLNPNKSVLEEFLSTDRLNCGGQSPRAILGAFLFSGQQVFKKVSSLSFGERVRLTFAKLTHQDNELLILDEPTNHLDLQAREAIEDALRAYGGAILLVSHDRYFISKINITRTIKLKNRTLH